MFKKHTNVERLGVGGGGVIEYPFIDTGQKAALNKMRVFFCFASKHRMILHHQK